MSITNTYDVSYSSQAPVYYQVTVGNTAKSLSGLSVPVPPWATIAFITPETGSLRYRCDGTAPTSTVGQPIASGQAWSIHGQKALAALQLIAASNTTVSVEFRG